MSRSNCIQCDYRVKIGFKTGMLEKDECIICLQKFDNNDHEQVYLEPCKHEMFGKKCILKWIQDFSNTRIHQCPYCKTNIESVKTQKDRDQCYPIQDDQRVARLEREVEQYIRRTDDELSNLRIYIDQAVDVNTINSKLAWLKRTYEDYIYLRPFCFRQGIDMAQFTESINSIVERLVPISNALISKIIVEATRVKDHEPDIIKQGVAERNLLRVAHNYCLSDSMKRDLDEKIEQTCLKTLHAWRQRTDNAENRRTSRMEEIVVLRDILYYKLSPDTARDVRNRFEQLIEEDLADWQQDTESQPNATDRVRKSEIELNLLYRALKETRSSDLHRKIEERSQQLYVNMKRIIERTRGNTNDWIRGSNERVTCNGCNKELKILACSIRCFCKRVRQLVDLQITQRSEVVIAKEKFARATMFEIITRMYNLYLILAQIFSTDKNQYHAELIDNIQDARWTNIMISEIATYVDSNQPDTPEKRLFLYYLHHKQNRLRRVMNTMQEILEDPLQSQ